MWPWKFLRNISLVVVLIVEMNESQNISISPHIDRCNSLMINGYFTYRVKNVVAQPQQVKPHVCAFDRITHNRVRCSQMAANQTIKRLINLLFCVKFDSGTTLSYK